MEDTSEASLRQSRGLVSQVVTVISVVYGLYTLLYVTNTLARLDIYINLVSHRALFLTFVTIMTFLTLPISGRGQRDKVPWYDLLFMVLGIAGPVYVFFKYDQLSYERYADEKIYTFEIVLAVLTLLATLEIARRAVGLAIVVMALVFLAHPLLGSHLPGFLFVQVLSPTQLAHFFMYSAEGVFGMVTGVAATIIITFMIFSQFLFATPAGKFFINISLALLGRYRGGPAKVGILASSLFGTLTGSPNANVAAVGSFTIPMMKRIGYQPTFAGAVEAVASTGGQLMPPVMGTTAFIMAQWLGISYWSICIAAILPCLLYYLGLFMAVDAEAVKQGLQGLPREQCPSIWKTLKEGWAAIAPLAVLIFLMGALRWDASISAVGAMLTAIALAMLSKKTRLKPRDFVNGFRGSGVSILSAGNACVCAGVMVASAVLTQFAVRVSDAIVALSGDSLLVLTILAAVLTYLVGMGVVSVATYMMVAVIAGPAFAQLGVPLLAAHLFIFYWVAISFFTPPEMTAVYVASGISGGNAMRTGVIAMRIAIASYLAAFMIIYRPELIMLGSPQGVILVFLSGAVATAFLAWGAGGFLLSHKVNSVQRTLLIIGAVLIVFPQWTVNLLGAAFGLAVFVPLYLKRQQPRIETAKN